ncbi:MAG: hypothetical protein WBG46_13075 [Nonlabens sp.]
MATALAQNDVVLKTDGEEMVGKVIKIDGQNIQFIHQNETLEYNVPKSDILKITFSSGRIQYFKKKKEAYPKNLEDHHNKVAILPFGYIKDQETSNPTMTKKIQQELYTIFKNKASILKFQDPITTNALLSKAGISNNIEGYTMGEICNVLGVEYVVQGLVSVEKTNVSNYSNTESSTKSKRKVQTKSKGHILGDIISGSKNSSSTYSSSVQNYSTNITMNVYTDKGENVYSKEHASFWQTQDAYKITLKYLAKRTPVYKR